MLPSQSIITPHASWLPKFLLSNRKFSNTPPVPQSAVVGAVGPETCVYPKIHARTRRWLLFWRSGHQLNVLQPSKCRALNQLHILFHSALHSQSTAPSKPSGEKQHFQRPAAVAQLVIPSSNGMYHLACATLLMLLLDWAVYGGLTILSSVTCV
jgi:hypothetical protein